MKEIVDRILKEEEKAHKRIQQAKLESEKMIKDTHRESEELISKAISQANDTAKLQKEQSEKKFLQEKEKILQEVKKQVIGIRGQKEKEIPELSRKVFSRIIEIL